MYLFAVAALFTACFVVGILHDRRRLVNAVYLFLALATASLALLITILQANRVAAAITVALIFFCFPLALVSLAFFLLWDGVTMLRREGRRPANLLALLAGLSMLAFPALYALAAGTRTRWLEIALLVVARPLAYVVFLFACFVLYSLVYERIPHRGGAPDFVVVLGSGLIGGDRVPPLLASRLDRAHAVITAEAASGRCPALIVSGGQGPRETVPEGRAMADYLLARGIPAERITVEDKSRTTRENLKFSAEIMDRLRPGGRCLVVTSNFHVMRTALLTRRLALNARVVGSPTALYFWPGAIVREFAAIFLSHPRVNAAVCGLLLILPVPGL
jgi:uncharacterized SAM-binding protein YcdF (DUF218 family)